MNILLIVYNDYFNTRDSVRKIKDPIEKTLNYEKIMKTVEKKYVSKIGVGSASINGDFAVIVKKL